MINGSRTCKFLAGDAGFVVSAAISGIEVNGSAPGSDDAGSRHGLCTEGLTKFYSLVAQW